MTSDAEPPATDPWLTELFHLAPRIIRVTDAALRGLSPPLTYRQFRLLQRISQGHTTLTQIGRVATLSLPSISEALDVLAGKQLIDRRQDGDDRRSSRLLLTPLGRSLLEDGNSVLAELSDELLEGVDDDDRRLVRDVLGVVGERVAKRLHRER